MIAKANITHKNGFNAGHPTVLLQFNKDFEVGGDRMEANRSGSQVQPDWRGGNSEKGARLVGPSMHNREQHKIKSSPTHQKKWINYNVASDAVHVDDEPETCRSGPVLF